MNYSITEKRYAKNVFGIRTPLHMNWSPEMSDSAIFVILVFAVLVDMCGLFPTWIGDRLAFIGYLAALSAGFNNGGIASVVNGVVNGFFSFIVSMYDAPITRGAAAIGPQILAGFILLVTIGAFAPVRWSKLLGTFAHVNFSDLKYKRAPNQAQMKGPAVIQQSSFAAGFIKKLFPGTVNIGMVILAVLLVSSNATVSGGVGTSIDRIITASQTVGNNLSGPIVNALPKK